MKAKIITDTIYIYTYLRDGYNLKDKGGIAGRQG